jgi:hypothetical protein
MLHTPAAPTNYTETHDVTPKRRLITRAAALWTVAVIAVSLSAGFGIGTLTHPTIRPNTTDHPTNPAPVSVADCPQTASQSVQLMSTNELQHQPASCTTVLL